jgi:hypothetical protein
VYIANKSFTIRSLNDTASTTNSRNVNDIRRCSHQSNWRVATYSKNTSRTKQTSFPALHPNWAPGEQSLLGMKVRFSEHHPMASFRACAYSCKRWLQFSKSGNMRWQPGALKLKRAVPTIAKRVGLLHFFRCSPRIHYESRNHVTCQSCSFNFKANCNNTEIRLQRI